jgi:hypothetical protein
MVDEHPRDVDDPPRLAGGAVIVRLRLGKLVPLDSDELSLGLLVGGALALEEPEEVHLDSEDPAQRDLLGRPEQDLRDPHGEEVALVQQVGDAWSAARGPVGHAMEPDHIVFVSQPKAVQARRLPGLHRHRHGRGIAGGPVDLLHSTLLPLELRQLLPVRLLQRRIRATL